jgi:hypothetical protein
MHYGHNYFSKNGQDTIVAKNGAIIARDPLSVGDIAGINQLYAAPHARFDQSVFAQTPKDISLTIKLQNTGTNPFTLGSSGSLRNWVKSIVPASSEVLSGESIAVTLNLEPCTQSEFQSTTITFAVNNGGILELPLLRMCYENYITPILYAQQATIDAIQLTWADAYQATRFSVIATSDGASLAVQPSELTTTYSYYPTSARVQITNANGLSGKNVCLQIKALDSTLPPQFPPGTAERCLKWH